MTGESIARDGRAHPTGAARAGRGPTHPRPSGRFPDRWRRAVGSIRGRILLWLLVGVVPLFLASEFLSTYVAERALVRGAEHRAEAEAQLVARELDGITRLIEARVQGVAATLATVELEPTGVEQLIRSLVMADPRIYGSTIAFEPHAWSPNVSDYAPYVHRTGDGLREVDLARPQPSYREQPWYRLPRELGRDHWSEPYFDTGGGEVWMITYSMPFRLKAAPPSARLSGVVTADISLAWLRELIARLHVVEGAAAFLVSPGGALVSGAESGGEAGATAGVETTRRLEELRAGGQRLAASGGTIGRVADPAGGADVYLTYHPLRAGWALGLVFPERLLLASSRRVGEMWLVFVLLALAVMGLVVCLATARITRPLEALVRAVERIGRGDLETTLPDAPRGDEVSVLTQSVERMRVSLQGHIAERAAALAARERMAGELEIARQIQQSMLPPPGGSEIGGGRYLVSAVLRPAREVAGDLYDFFTVSDQRLVFAVGDVSGKGIPAALFMARAATLLRTVGPSAEPDRILRELDARLSHDNDACMFVTLGCGLLDASTGRLRYASAGHEPPLVRLVGGGVTSLDPEGGPALGLSEGSRFPCHSTHLAPGDMLVAYTDGVTEAFNPNGQAFGRERLCRLLARGTAETPSVLADSIAGAVERFAVGGGPWDDVTVLVLQYRLPLVTVLARNPEEWRLTLAGRLDEVPRAQQSVAAILRARAVPSRVVDDSLLILEEVVANVVTHGYRGDATRCLEIDIQVTPDAQVRLRFADDGPAFDPLAHPPPDLDATIDQRAVGGLGVWLVRQLAARCEYARDEGRNLLTVVCRTAGDDRPSPAT